MPLPFLFSFPIPPSFTFLPTRLVMRPFCISLVAAWLVPPRCLTRRMTTISFFMVPARFALLPAPLCFPRHFPGLFIGCPLPSSLSRPRSPLPLFSSLPLSPLPFFIFSPTLFFTWLSTDVPLALLCALRSTPFFAVPRRHSRARTPFLFASQSHKNWSFRISLVLRSIGLCGGR